VTSTTRSRNPAAAACPGENTSASVTALENAAGVSRAWQSSIAACGTASPIATSLAVIRNGPATPMR